MVFSCLTRILESDLLIRRVSSGWVCYSTGSNIKNLLFQMTTRPGDGRSNSFTFGRTSTIIGKILSWTNDSCIFRRNLGIWNGGKGDVGEVGLRDSHAYNWIHREYFPDIRCAGLHSRKVGSQWACVAWNFQGRNQRSTVHCERREELLGHQEPIKKREELVDHVQAFELRATGHVKTRSECELIPDHHEWDDRWSMIIYRHESLNLGLPSWNHISKGKVELALKKVFNL